MFANSLTRLPSFDKSLTKQPPPSPEEVCNVEDNKVLLDQFYLGAAQIAVAVVDDDRVNTFH